MLNLPLEKYAVKRREPEHVRKAYLEKMIAIGRTKAYSPWWAKSKYEAIYGEKLPKEWMSLILHG